MMQQGSDKEQLGVRADVQDTGFVTSRMDVFLWLDHWCALADGWLAAQALHAAPKPAPPP